MNPPTAAIREPRDLELPAEEEALLGAIQQLLHGDSKFSEFAQMLTDKGVREFAGELVAALVQAKHDNDLRPVQEVIESWYRTSLFIKEPGFLKSLGDDADEESIARDERKRLLGLA